MPCLPGCLRHELGQHANHILGLPFDLAGCEILPTCINLLAQSNPLRVYAADLPDLTARNNDHFSPLDRGLLVTQVVGVWISLLRDVKVEVPVLVDQGLVV